MTHYEEILATLRSVDAQQAEIMEEEINIMIHKLKFLPIENFPTVTILQQSNDFSVSFSESLQDKVRIAGGKLTIDVQEGPQVIIILKSDDSLYGALPTLFEQDWLQHAPAYQNNRIFIIETSDLEDKRNFLKDTEILAEILQPKYFHFGHEGNEWIKFDLVY